MHIRRWFEGPRARQARDRALRIYRSRRTRRHGLIALAALVVFGLLGFLAVPPLLKSQLQKRLTAALDRPVTIAAVHVNPFTLRVQLDALKIGGRDGKADFVDVDRLVVNASWVSLFRLAPVIDEITVQHPQIRLVRSAPQQFNVSDLVQRYGGPAAPGSQPARFALANISVHDGDIRLDDRVLKAAHQVDRLELGLPFLANLPSSTDVFVKPLLAARIDGSPMHIEGQTKPFARSLESSIDFRLDHLDLPRYLGYAPSPLPVTVRSGQLSGDVQLRFLADTTGNQLQLRGTLALDDLKLATPQGAALLELGHGQAELIDVQPLLARYHLGAVTLDQAALHDHVTADGRSTLDALTGGASAPPATGTPATDVRIATLTLQRGRLDYAAAAASDSKPLALSLDLLQGTITGLSTVKAPPGAMNLTARLSGGSIHAQGPLDLAAGRFDGSASLKQVALAPLQPMLLPAIEADIAGGQLDADGGLRVDWNKALDFTLSKAKITIHRFALKRASTTPVAWQTIAATVPSVDLASRTAQIDSMTVRGAKLDLNRLRNGQFDLLQLLPSDDASAPPTPAWHWRVAHLVVQDSDVRLRDLGADRTRPIELHAERYRIDGLSDDLHKPLAIAATGTLGRRPYSVSGSIRPSPLDARLQVKARGLDIAPLQSMISVPLNVRIGSALLGLDGRIGYRDRGRAPALVTFRGDARLGRVRVQDKLTGDDFLRWHALDAGKVNLRLGEGAPHMDIGGLALNDFYARVIVNANGRLNLQDVVANGTEAPVSVTRAEQPAAAAAAASARPPATVEPAGPAAEIAIGEITVARGQLNYTDNFIKPNYSANITDLGGRVGGFGTQPGPPAELQLQGKLDEKSPVDISGTINPLTPVAFLDISGKADDVELAGLSPYSGRYAGYPIASGVLTVDVHYQLDQRKLKADNHLFVDQLTFGDRLDGPGISHLPVKLAVALLRDSQGRIDVHVPVTGSLDDPKFSLGGLIWRAIGNLIVRAATAPFRLLGAIGGGKNADLAYVTFAPGSAVLDSAAQARLTRLVALLKSKPSLKLDITGRMDPAVDEKGLRKVMVDDQVRAAAADHDDSKGDPSTLKLTPDEYEHYLVRVYKKADFAKPKNVIGLTKSQPPDVMQQLLQTHMPVDTAALKQLAERRTAAVDGWLKGKLDPTRITLHPPKLDAKGISDKGPTSRVDFGLH